MTWAARRQLIIASIFFVALIGAAFLFVAPRAFVAPTCTDGEMNGDETGIDCGGGCVNFCAMQVKEPTVLWNRSFKVANSIYNAVAVIENQSPAAISALPYEFRLYDTRGVYIARVSGTTIVPPSGRYAIVETGINVGNASVGSTSFVFGRPSVSWQKIDPSVANLRVSTADAALDTSADIPRLSATLGNPSATVPLRNIAVAAILYDANNNAVNASKTFVESLPAQNSAPIVFTWPEKLSVPVVRYDIIPLIDVFSIK